MQAVGAAEPRRARAFIGREAELAVMATAVAQGGVAHVVRGQAGVGKSRLVREVGALAGARGSTVLVGRASSAGPTGPLRPVREALLAAARRGLRPGTEMAPFVPTLAALVPEWGDGAGAPTERSPLLLGEALLRLLAAGSGQGHATLLVIEDVQWADPETLAVLEYLVDNLDAWPVALIITLRDGEQGAGTEAIVDLVRRRAATEVRLGPLDHDDVLAVARSCLADAEVPAEVEATLVARSEGLPFLVEELVAAAVSAGWDTVDAAIPGSVRAAVELRLDRLARSARPLLTAGALLGRSFDWLVAARAARQEPDAAAELLRAAVRAQLVDVEGPGYQFRHALTRDAVLALASPAEVSLLAERALDAMHDAPEPLSGDRGVVAAGLAERVGRLDDAAELLLEAARAALDGGALASAGLLAERARRIAPPAWVDRADRTLMEVAVLTGDSEQAARLGSDLLARVPDDSARGDLHLLLGSADLAAGRWEAAEERADAATAADPTDVDRRARASSLAALAAMGRDDVEVAVERARRALEDARATGQVAVQCEALEVLGRVERGRDLAAAEAAFQQAHDLADQAGLALWRARAMQELGTIDMYDGLRLERMQEARRQAEGLGALAMVALADLQISAIHDERGELHHAMAAARRCCEVSGRLGLSTLSMGWVAQAKVHARRGDRAAMDHAVERALATGEDRAYVEAGVWGNVEPIFHLVIGDLRAAAATFDNAMATVRARPAAVFPFPGLWALLRTVLDDDGEAARAEVAALPFDTPVSGRSLAAAEAVALGQAGRREEAAALFAQADADLLAGSGGGGLRPALVRLIVAPAAATAGWGDPEGWLRGTLADVERLGLDALAGRCRAELRALGAAVPRRSAVADTDAVPPVLAALGVTPREVDVLALVAGGATNRAVAERLVISVRTVDKHVERLLQKTGTTRAGLVAVAVDAGLLRT